VFTDIFKFDANYLEHEEKYKELKVEILGEESDEDDSDSGSDEDSEDEDEGKAILSNDKLSTC
jgi:pre-mRNA-splicing factor CWC22